MKVEPNALSTPTESTRRAGLSIKNKAVVTLVAPSKLSFALMHAVRNVRSLALVFSGCIVSDKLIAGPAKCAVAVASRLEQAVDAMSLFAHLTSVPVELVHSIAVIASSTLGLCLTV